MIRKTEKYYTKRIRKYKGVNRTYDEYGTQYIKKTTYWLLFIIPIFIKNEVVKGDYVDIYADFE